MPANGHYLARARRYVQDLDADGGTEMAGALSLAMGMDSSESTGHVQQMVFMTDGAVGNESALFDQIRTGLGNRRLFTVAIGSAPNMHFLREAARWGRGQTSRGAPVPPRRRADSRPSRAGRHGPSAPAGRKRTATMTQAALTSSA